MLRALGRVALTKMVPWDTKQRERMRLITEYRRVAKRIGQQAALDCFEVVWRTGVDEMFHDMMGCHDCVQNGEVVYCEKSEYNWNHPFHQCLYGPGTGCCP